MDLRLIVDPPARGTWNMAVDEALFQVAQHSRQTTIRFYQWSEPTLSLGYFQPFAERHSHRASRDCPLIRRSTGGGAIVHDHELTYSFVTPLAENRSAGGSLRYVQLIHAALIAALESLGACPYRHSKQDRASPGTEPFLCFQRRSADDVIIGDHKVAGSAQRRSHGTLLQHGSVLLSRSAAAPELLGIRDLLVRNVAIGMLLEDCVRQLAEGLAGRLTTATRTGEEDELARQIEKARFATFEWNRRR